MLFVATYTLHYLGVVTIHNQAELNDPTTEAEFLKIKYNAPRQITWAEYTNAIEPAKIAKGLMLVRMYRTSLLQQSDYIMLPDFSKKILNITDFENYRQALRDFTNKPIHYLWIKPYESLNFKEMNFPQLPTIVYK